MTQNVRLGLLAIGFLIIVWFFNQLHLGSQNNELLKEEVSRLQSKAVYFSQLQKRWAKKGEKKRVLRKLASIKAFDKQFSKSQNEVFSYDALDAKTLDRICYTLFSSDVVLVSFEISKAKETTSMRVELK